MNNIILCNEHVLYYYTNKENICTVSHRKCRSYETHFAHHLFLMPSTGEKKPQIFAE